MHNIWHIPLLPIFILEPSRIVLIVLFHNLKHELIHTLLFHDLSEHIAVAILTNPLLIPDRDLNIRDATFQASPCPLYVIGMDEWKLLMHEFSRVIHPEMVVRSQQTLGRRQFHVTRMLVREDNRVGFEASGNQCRESQVLLVGNVLQKEQFSGSAKESKHPLKLGRCPSLLAMLLGSYFGLIYLHWSWQFQIRKDLSPHVMRCHFPKQLVVVSDLVWVTRVNKFAGIDWGEAVNPKDEESFEKLEVEFP